MNLQHMKYAVAVAETLTFFLNVPEDYIIDENFFL